MSWHLGTIAKFVFCKLQVPGRLSAVSSHLRDVDLALVHEFDDCHNVRKRCVLQYHHLVRLVEVDEQLLEV